MKLNQIARLIGCKLQAEGIDVLGVTEDSRRVKPGTLFVAVSGSRSDGHDFAREAVASGAVAIVGSRQNTFLLEGVPYLYASSPRHALGEIAHALEGNPSAGMKVIGVTGTNGKSSTVAIIHRVLEASGRSAAVLGTLGYIVGGVHKAAPHTTPFGEDLAALFGQARRAGHDYLVMEVSSHSLDQDRVAGIGFTCGAFTNLTQDHLDYHGDMDAYRRAKLLLFEGIAGLGRFTVVNADDPSGPVFIAASKVPCHTFGSSGDCRAEDVRHGPHGTRFVARTPWGDCAIEMSLIGNHNVSNVLCAIAVCGGFEMPMDQIAAGIARVDRVRGRFERVDGGQPFQVVIDYAHTDDGLKNAIAAAREICDNRVITVFGCGGDRDRLKRPKMGQVAASMSDYAIVTSDNPRSEDPMKIIADIEPGVIAGGGVKMRNYEVQPDRAAAIDAAISMAETGDLVLIAGKGHEDYQILGDRRIHFDDTEVALDAIQRRMNDRCR